MYPTYREQQRKEVETIRPRVIEIKLSDIDVKLIAEKAGAHGLTVGELLENFIGDLVGGTYSNGSDERDFADQWFERCWFGMAPNMTFLNYLVDWGRLDEILEACDGISDSEDNIRIAQEELSSGIMQGSRGKTYTWRDITSSDGAPIYASQEEWEAEQRAYIEREQDLINNLREIVTDCWNEYMEQNKEYSPGTFDQEMKRVLDWRKDYQRILKSGPGTEGCALK